MRAASAQLADASEDRAGHIGATGAKHARIDRYWKCPCKRLHQVATREPIPGISCEADDPVMPARYEIHLDRKLERTLALLFRLRKLRREDVPEPRSNCLATDVRRAGLQYCGCDAGSPALRDVKTDR